MMSATDYFVGPAGFLDITDCVGVGMCIRYGRISAVAGSMMGIFFGAQHESFLI